MPQKCRKILAEGLIWSKLTYLIEVWEGVPQTYLKRLQIIMNNTARFVTGDRRCTSKMTLLNKCKWLSIEETVRLYTGVQMWNVLRRKISQNLATKFVLIDDNLVSTEPACLMTTTTNFHWRVMGLWNNLSQDLRDDLSLPSFKRKLRKWNVDGRQQSN